MDSKDQARVAILLSSCVGALENIKSLEPARHTRRYRETDKVIKQAMKLFELYPKALDHDVVGLAMAFFDEQLDERLKQVIDQATENLS